MAYTVCLSRRPSSGVDLKFKSKYVLFLAIVFPGIVLQMAQGEPSTSPMTISGIRVQLIDGSDVHEGVLEISNASTWIPVCGDGVQIEAAHVVCKQLGFHGADVITNVTRFLNEAVFTALINVSCESSDSIRSLDDCQLGAVVKGRPCNEKAAHITCLTTRLTGGPDMSSGRLEVWLAGFGWGKVCSPDFGQNEQMVACRELGYPFVSMSSVQSAEQFKDSNVPYAWGNVSCIGSETKLVDCNVDTSGSTSCPGDNEAFASCTNVETDPVEPSTTSPMTSPDIHVQPSDGLDIHEGCMLEIYNESTWLPACRDGVRKEVADMVCKQLGFHGADVITNETEDVTYIALLSVTRESAYYIPSLDDCHDQPCNEKMAHITCMTTRLTDMSSGRLEVWSADFDWGKVCSLDFGENEQMVTCRELGHLSINMSYVQSAIQFKSTDLSYDRGNESCNGFDATLIDCNMNHTNSSCPIDNVAFASCTETDPGRHGKVNAICLCVGIPIASIIVFIVGFLIQKKWAKQRKQSGEISPRTDYREIRGSDADQGIMAVTRV